MAKNQNPALDVVREELPMNGEGLYYVATEAMFQISYTLCRYGAAVPAAWEFSPGAWTPSEDDNSEENQESGEGSYMGAEFDLMMQQGGYSNLIHAGNVLDRLREVMNAEGLGL